MKTLIKGALIAVLLLVALPEQAQSQSVQEIVREAQERAEVERERANDRREAERRRDNRATRPDRDRRAQEQRRTADRGRATQNQRGGNGAGPPFCRNGAGHPVHGMQWCHDKGFGSGHTWRPGSIGDIIIGRDTRRSGSLSGRALEDVLGRDVSRRVQDLGRQGGFTGHLLGTWIDQNTLELSIGGAPLIRLLDQDGNGRVVQALIAAY